MKILQWLETIEVLSGEWKNITIVSMVCNRKVMVYHNMYEVTSLKITKSEQKIYYACYIKRHIQFEIMYNWILFGNLYTVIFLLSSCNGYAACAYDTCCKDILKEFTMSFNSHRIGNVGWGKTVSHNWLLWT